MEGIVKALCQVFDDLSQYEAVDIARAIEHEIEQQIAAALPPAAPGPDGQQPPAPAPAGQPPAPAAVSSPNVCFTCHGRGWYINEFWNERETCCDCAGLGNHDHQLTTEKVYLGLGKGSITVFEESYGSVWHFRHQGEQYIIFLDDPEKPDSGFYLAKVGREVKPDEWPGFYRAVPKYATRGAAVLALVEHGDSVVFGGGTPVSTPAPAAISAANRHTADTARMEAARSIVAVAQGRRVLHIRKLSAPDRRSRRAQLVHDARLGRRRAPLPVGILPTWSDIFRAMGFSSSEVRMMESDDE